MPTTDCISLESAHSQQDRNRFAVVPASVNIYITPVCIHHVSTKPAWGPVIELVDLRYRPELNTIGALAESDPSEHAPLVEPIHGPQRQRSTASESLVDQN